MQMLGRMAHAAVRNSAVAATRQPTVHLVTLTMVQQHTTTRISMIISISVKQLAIAMGVTAVDRMVTQMDTLMHQRAMQCELLVLE